jgi:hypothetical protein
VESPAHAGIQACAFENTSADYGPAVALDTAVNKETFVWLASVSAPPATNEDVNGSARGTAIAMYQKPATIWADDPAAHPVFSRPGSALVFPRPLSDARSQPHFLVFQRAAFEGIARVSSSLMNLALFFNRDTFVLLARAPEAQP